MLLVLERRCHGAEGLSERFGAPDVDVGGEEGVDGVDRGVDDFSGAVDETVNVALIPCRTTPRQLVVISTFARL